MIRRVDADDVVPIQSVCPVVMSGIHSPLSTNQPLVVNGTKGLL
jgi:hypothetical protein